MTDPRLFDRQPWVESAACNGADPALFFPARGESDKEAKAVCRSCPVKRQCLDDGMNERFGIRGGLSARERRNIRITQRPKIA